MQKNDSTSITTSDCQSKQAPIEFIYQDCGDLDAFYGLLGEKAILLPIPLGTKGPIFKQLSKTTFERTQALDYQDDLGMSMFRRGNLGVLLGNGLATIDLDDDSLADQFLDVNPTLANTLRTRGARGCQFWIWASGAHPKSCDIKLAGNKVAEWRAEGRQSVIYGNHPDGNRYQTLVRNPPVSITFKEINWPDGWRLPGEREASPGAEETTRSANASPELQRRIQAYVDAIPGAVAHQGGHKQTFTVACELINGWALAADDALSYLRTYNDRCEPVWREGELAHKIAEAEKAAHTKPRGYLLEGEPPIDIQMKGNAEAKKEEPPPDTTEWFEDDDLQFLDRSKDPACMIGNRWLCKGGSLIIQGFTGIGKSSFALQMAMHWSVKRVRLNNSWVKI